jgi:hypothetical protein
MKNTTTCPKIGIKIHESNNNYNKNPFESINQNVINRVQSNNNTINNTQINRLTTNNFDLNIDNYSMKDIFHLFNIQSEILDENLMKESKKFVLKTHPDKSGLDPKYFLFYSSAYKKLYGVFEFQNKSSKKKIDNEDYSNESNNKVLDNLFNNNKALKESHNFNEWFNQQFDKYKLDDDLYNTNNKGYGDWLKSDRGLIDTSNVSKADMANEFEKHKKQIQSMTVYNGVNDVFSSTFGATILTQNANNYSSGILFQDNLGFTDLKQAYEESVIPITEDDYKNVPKYNNLNDYKNARDSTNVVPTSKEEAMKRLVEQQKREEEESIALAFQLAKQNEEAQKKQKTFWGELKQITGW